MQCVTHFSSEKIVEFFVHHSGNTIHNIIGNKNELVCTTPLFLCSLFLFLQIHEPVLCIHLLFVPALEEVSTGQIHFQDICICFYEEFECIDHCICYFLFHLVLFHQKAGHYLFPAHQ